MEGQDAESGGEDRDQLTAGASYDNPTFRLRDSNNLDLLRLLFASLVIFSHAYAFAGAAFEPPMSIFHTLSFGSIAIDGFFSLSGYLITLSWMRSPHPLPFLAKRVFRIYPAFVIAFVASVLLFGPLGASSRAEYFSGLDWMRLMKAIVFLQSPPTPPVFADTSYPLVNASMWTISYEFRCYAAVAVLGVLGLLQSRRVVLALWLLLTLAFVGLHLWAADPAVEVSSRVGQASRFAMLFSGGMVFAQYPIHRPDRGWWVAAAAVIVVLAMFSPLLVEPVLSSVGAFLILSLGFFNFGPIRPRGFPDVSYGTYLYGWPVAMVVVRYAPGLTPPLVFLVAWTGALLLGALSWYLIEKPALRTVTKLIRQRDNR